MIEYIRKRGPKLILGYQILPERYRAGGVLFRFEPHFTKPPTFEESLALERRLTGIYVKRCQPYLYWVVVEPATNEMRLGVSFSPEQWRRLTVEICRLVKRLNPKTLTGVATDHVKQIEAFADVPELDVLGHDLYGKRDLGEFEKMVALAKKHGKRARLAETWLSVFVLGASVQPTFSRRRCDENCDSVQCSMLHLLILNHGRYPRAGTKRVEISVQRRCEHA